MTITPTMTFADCPQLDVICVPGGVGTDDMVNDEEMLDFLRKQASGAKYITSVCTGSLVLGAAGLLKGYRATTHWSAMDFIWRHSVRADQDAGLRRPQSRQRRRRHRGNRFRADAGVDLVDRQTAETIQLRLEYNPAPPFNSGSPDTAPAEVLARHEGENCAIRAAPRRGDRARCRTDGSDGNRKRPPGFPDGLSCPTAAPH